MNTFNSDFYDALTSAVDRLPPEAIERTKKENTRKGYDTTGYQYQFLVNVLNSVITPAGWNYEYKIVKELTGTYKSGQQYHEITVEMTIDILGTKRVCVGGHVSSFYADALKGAITNALKKTLGMFGIGKKAYEGTIDEDYLPIQEIETFKCCKCDRTDTKLFTVQGKDYHVCPLHAPTNYEK